MLVMFQKLSDMVKADVIQNVMEGKTTLSITGTISYTDVFDVPHTVKCGATFNPKTGGFNADPTETD